MQSLTPVVFVEAIEPCLSFWHELGFETTMEVPGERLLGFAALKSGDVEVMYQSFASLEADMPALLEQQWGPTNFFIRVDDLDSLKPTLESGDVVVPERDTFYGSREIAVRAPCGTVVTFAEFPDEA